MTRTQTIPTGPPVGDLSIVCLRCDLLGSLGGSNPVRHDENLVGLRITNVPEQLERVELRACELTLVAWDGQGIAEGQELLVGPTDPQWGFARGVPLSVSTAADCHLVFRFSPAADVTRPGAMRLPFVHIDTDQPVQLMTVHDAGGLPTTYRFTPGAIEMV